MLVAQLPDGRVTEVTKQQPFKILTPLGEFEIDELRVRPDCPRLFEISDVEWENYKSGKGCPRLEAALVAPYDAVHGQPRHEIGYEVRCYILDAMKMFLHEQEARGRNDLRQANTIHLPAGLTDLLQAHMDHGHMDFNLRNEKTVLGCKLICDAPEFKLTYDPSLPPRPGDCDYVSSEEE